MRQVSFTLHFPQFSWLLLGSAACSAASLRPLHLSSCVAWGAAGSGVVDSGFVYFLKGGFSGTLWCLWTWPLLMRFGKGKGKANQKAGKLKLFPTLWLILSPLQVIISWSAAAHAEVAFAGVFEVLGWQLHAAEATLDYFLTAPGFEAAAALERHITLGRTFFLPVFDCAVTVGPVEVAVVGSCWIGVLALLHPGRPLPLFAK